MLQTFSQDVDAHATGLHRCGGGHVQCGARMALQEDKKSLNCRRQRDTGRDCPTVAGNEAPLHGCWQPSKSISSHQCGFPASAGIRAFRDGACSSREASARAASVTTSIAAPTALSAASLKSPSVRAPFRAPFLVASATSLRSATSAAAAAVAPATSARPAISLPALLASSPRSRADLRICFGTLKPATRFGTFILGIRILGMFSTPGYTSRKHGRPPLVPPLTVRRSRGRPA